MQNLPSINYIVYRREIINFTTFFKNLYHVNEPSLNKVYAKKRAKINLLSKIIFIKIFIVSTNRHFFNSVGKIDA